MIEIKHTEILSEIAIDHFEFKVTRNPVNSGSCILWYRDTINANIFEALGRFSGFDQCKVLFFIARYVTNGVLREKIDDLRFEQRVARLSRTFFREIERMRFRDKEQAYRQLFNLDEQINAPLLSRRRRIMAGKFHPDVGGDHYAMLMINEAYDFLVQHADN